MKKLFTIAFVLSLSATAFAQGFYLKLGLGYAFPEAGQTIDGTSTPYSGTQTNPVSTAASYPQNYNIKSASFSAGFQGGIGLGYMFTDHVGVQLDAGVGLGTKKYTYDDQNVYISGSQADLSIIQQAKSPFIITPSIVLQTGGDPWNIYARMGLAIPLNTKIIQDEVVTFPASSAGGFEVDDYTFQLKNSFSLGFSAAAGVQYKLNDRVSIFGEVSLLSMSVFIKQSTLTSLNATTTAGTQNVPLSNVSGPITVKYSKKASVDSSGDQEPAYSQPFSNVGINVGLSLKLGNQTSSKSHRGQGRGDDDLIDNSKPYRRH